MTIIDELGYGKVCARLVPQMLSDRHKKIRKAVSTDLLRHTIEARASCCRLSLVTKPGSTILNLTPSGNC